RRHGVTGRGAGSSVGFRHGRLHMRSNGVSTAARDQHRVALDSTPPLRIQPLEGEPLDGTLADGTPIDRLNEVNRGQNRSPGPGGSPQQADVRIFRSPEGARSAFLYAWSSDRGPYPSDSYALTAA